MKVYGTGHIRPMEEGARCRRWQLRVKTEQGEKTRTVHGTKREAQAALSELVRTLEQTAVSTDGFHEYADAWLQWRVDSGELERGTIQNLGRDIRTLKRAIATGTAVADMDAEFWRYKLMEIKNGNNASGRTLSNTYMGDIYDTAKAIFDQAFAEDKITKHPFVSLKRPTPDTKEKPCLDPGRLSTFLDTLDKEPLDGRIIATYLICEMGLRRGEACALTVEDVKCLDGMWLLDVHQAVKDRKGTIGETKTNAGTRLLPIPSRMVGKLMEWLTLRDLLEFDSPWLCCNTIGGMLRPQNYWTWFEKHKEGWGIPEMTPHLLRHSNLSKMARYMGVFELKTWAGWSSIEPAKIYIHDDITALAAAVKMSETAQVS